METVGDPEQHFVAHPQPHSGRVLESVLQSVEQQDQPVAIVVSKPPSPNVPPPVPPKRSPLRPPSRSVKSGQQIITQPFIKPGTPPPPENPAQNSMPVSFQIRNRSFPSLKGLIEAVNPSTEDDLLAKPHEYTHPDSPIEFSPILMDDEPASSNSSMVQSAKSTKSSASAPLSKRQHALMELLESERAYASDLALMREVHIPLALGLSADLHPAPTLPITPPRSSGSSSRTMSTASDSSNASSLLGPAMTQDEVKIIFNNIPELALFSDHLCDRLQDATALDGAGENDDYVGALFLDIIPGIEKPFKYYITRQASGDEYLRSMPKTPALEAYYNQTRTIASSISHAWDLHSLLIKPVQRLLKYPLLLAAILEETPDSHPDKENLILARSKIEEIARNVNEERRRAEVVKGVLTAKKKTAVAPLGVTASVSLGKMKALKKSMNPGEIANDEALKVEKMEGEMKEIELFAQKLAKDIVDWQKTMATVIFHLRNWSISFGKVIGLSDDQGSEAFDAFLEVIEKHLMPLCMKLEASINDELLKGLAALLATMNKPMKLLHSMNEQEPLHYHLLNMNVTQKNRPPAALLEASTNYLALRAQLAAELPKYLNCMYRGLSIYIYKLANIQAQYWKEVRAQWSDLWDMLRVEGEMNAGAEETVAVWHNRWADVDDVLAALNITSPKKVYQDPLMTYRPPPVVTTPDPPQSPYRSSRGSSVSNVANTLMALDPHFPQVSSPLPLSASSMRSVPRQYRGSLDSSSSSGLSRRQSTESLRTGRSRVAKSPKPVQEGISDYVSVDPMAVPIPRTKSMPLPRLDPSVSPPNSRSQFTSLEPIDERGRIPSKPSFRRKITDTMRNSSKGRHRAKSPSVGSLMDLTGAPPVAYRDQRSAWAKARPKYACKAVSACRPLQPVTYHDFPFLNLGMGDVCYVLHEAGHPSLHDQLPIHVDDGEDCLLLVRDQRDIVGWALASFLEPLSLS